MGAISLTVEDLPWEQHEDFRTSGPEDRHFVVETGFDGTSRVLFGDGVNGARLPTGRDNVAARYRIGQGSEGNVPARVLKKPTAKPAFLKEVFNPETTAGGADPDKESGLRSKIPTEHLTFDRAVSLRDYADLALAYPGVGKAKSGWRWRHGRQYVVLAVYGEHGQDLTSILGDLRAYLDARRDINQPLLVQEVAMVAVRLTIRVATLPGYDAEKVKDAITTSVGTGVNDDGTLQFFNPDRLDIGMSIHAKEVYRLLEQVPGVGRIRELTMERCPPTADGDGVLLPAFCPGDVWIHSWELAELDAARLDVEVEQPPTKAVCERSGG
jgi:predicted phage baseplate assembly protein